MVNNRSEYTWTSGHNAKVRQASIYCGKCDAGIQIEGAPVPLQVYENVANNRGWSKKGGEWICPEHVKTEWFPWLNKLLQTFKRKKS